MSVFQQLQPASFRGFPFLVNTETKTGGKKTVTHEYVNSDKRFTEELGKLPPSFVIEAIIKGDNAIEDRKGFELILELPGLGELIHPIYGTLQVKSTIYSVSSNQTKIGEFKFSVNFETSEAVINPTPELAPSESLASASAELAKEAVFTTFEFQYKDPTTPSVLDRVAGLADAVFGTVFDTIDAVQNTIQSNVSTFTRVVNTARNKIFTIVQKGNSIRSSLEALYLSALEVANTPSDLSDAWESLLDFGFTEPSVQIGETLTQSLSDSKKVDTAQRIEEDISKTVLRESTRLIALINLYEALAFKDFETDTEIDKARELLNEAYNTQMELMLIDDTDTLSDDQLNVNSPLSNDPDVRRTIQKLRSDVNRILDQKEQNTWRVTSVRQVQTSMLLTSYRYYGNIENINLLVKLNPGLNHANFDEPVQVISK